MDLDQQDQTFLLTTARRAMEESLKTGDHLKVSPPNEKLAEPRGCFVSLFFGDALRGCVGTTSARESLLENVLRMSVSVLSQDSRFEPVRRDELKELEIQIEVVGDLERIQLPDDIEIGRHGIVVKLGKETGTYLPDIALEQDWNPLEFMMDCAREKAKLKPEQIAQAEIYRFEVQKFSETP